MFAVRRSPFRTGAPLRGLILAALVASAARAQVSRESVERALDQRLKEVRIEDAPIVAAFEALGRRAGVAFAVDRDVLDRMPYGEQTEVSFEIRDLSVRDALRTTLAGLGLRFEAQEEAVRVLAAEWLERLNRRVTVQELRLIQRLAERDADDLDADEIDFRLPGAARVGERFAEAAALSPGSSALDALAAACETLGWTWEPSGERIVVMPRSEDVRRRLERPLSLTYQRARLDEVLVDLGRRSGVTMMFEPGALAQVDAGERHLDLIQPQTTARQALELICGNTGLRYEAADDGVRISGPAGAASGPTAADIQRWIRVGIEIEAGVTVDVFLRMDQLPPEFQERCARRLAEILGPAGAASRPGSP